MLKFLNLDYKMWTLDSKTINNSACMDVDAMQAMENKKLITDRILS